jgi:multiple sugar transport system permease protein
MAKYVIFALIAFVMLSPMWWMVSGSFQDSRGIIAMPPRAIPTEPTLLNYQVLFKPAYNSTSILWAAVNTVALALIAVVLHVGVAFTAGYAFALRSFRGSEVLFWAFMASMTISAYMLLIPHYVIVSKLGLTNTLLGVALPYVFAPFPVFFARNYIESIPTSLLDAARIDGASEARILRVVLLPLCAPVAGVLALFAGMRAFGDYIWPSLVLQYPEARTLYVEIIHRMRDAGRVIEVPTIGLQLAGGVILLVPALIIFALTSRHMIDGLKTGGVKE